MRRSAAALATTVTLLAPASAPAAERSACAAWPNEIAPQSTESQDAFAARFAKLRSDELAAVAAAIERTDPASAYRLWQHALCLQPKDPALKQRVAQLAPRQDYVRVPIVVRAKPAAERPRVQFTGADKTIEGVGAAVADARFREALELASKARSLLAGMSAVPEVLARRARLELLTGTAELALGMEDAARLSLQRALQADPALEPDENTPPKVRRLLASVRGLPEGAQQ